MKTTKIFFVILLYLFVISDTSFAFILFQDDFNFGEPELFVDIAHGADNDWYTSQLVPVTTSSLQKSGMSIPDAANPDMSNNRFAYFRDGFSIMQKVNTTNFSGVVLNFEYGIRQLNPNSEYIPTLYGAYYIGEIMGFDSNRHISLLDPSHPANWDNWVKFDFTGVNSILGDPFVYNTSGPVLLPDNEGNVWFTFTTDTPGNHSGAFLHYVDNIEITGTNTIPEPASLMLMASGLFGFALTRRKRV